MFTSLKSIKKGFKRSSGRNNQGKITIRHRGGGNKRKLYIVDFYRNIKVETILKKNRVRTSKKNFVIC